ncbi:MAG TPA: hypothetical protein VFY75_05055 [Solirubrobacterales bacterium]|nr:hypothetical protein [Solirubrobacterales bacterium]
MPVPAQFSEREYELAMNIELLAGNGKYSVPSQVAEKWLGYDIALVPGLTSVWGLLGLSAPPIGVPPGQGILGHPSAPAFAASLFLQYKRPEELRGGSAKEAAPRREAGVAPPLPYLRYGLGRFQLDRLLNLQAEVSGLAEVCYAAASFVSGDHLKEMQALRAVVSSSDFLSLGKVDSLLGPGGPGADHVWTYDAHEPAGGVLCSEPRKVRSYRGWQLLEGLAEALGEEPVTLENYVYELDQAVDAWSVRELGSISKSPSDWPWLMQLPGVARAALNVERTARRHGLGWVLAYREARI